MQAFGITLTSLLILSISLVSMAADYEISKFNGKIETNCSDILDKNTGPSAKDIALDIEPFSTNLYKRIGAVPADTVETLKKKFRKAILFCSSPKTSQAPIIFLVACSMRASPG
jgi:hypothetical protein